MGAPQAIGQNWIAVRVILKLAIGAVRSFQFLRWPRTLEAGNRQFRWPRLEPVWHGFKRIEVQSVQSPNRSATTFPGLTPFTISKA